ncbi:MAG TPA: isoleucine--tRNA ligase [Polyangiaceae bacterium]|nr:isoleucine--tRNA ligase [Polyangiaceae bacterium]
MSGKTGVFAKVRPELDFPTDEAKILAFWKERKIFDKSLTAETRATGPSKGTFVFYEGPPTANGMPHNGHVLTRAVKDVFPRYKTMQGYDVPRKAGWDTHGLPVEVEVEKELRIHGKADIEKYGVEPFTHRCIESVFRYTEAWEKLTDKIAFWVDLPSAYVTFHKSYVESVWWSLSNLFQKGLLYQGHKVVWWWAQGGTALSSAEVGLGYKTVDDPSVFVAFPFAGDDKTALLVWTTTPWTLPSNMYAAVHPSFEYAFVTGAGERTLVMAKDLVPKLADKLKAELTIVKTVKGTDLVGTKYVPPFDVFAAESQAHAKVHSVIAADFVLMDASGIVHVAPAFGEDDHQAHQRLLRESPELPLLCTVKADGTFDERLPKYAGRWVKDCDKDIQHELKERALLVHAEIYRHDYPFCWRADSDPLIQFARPAWYIQTTRENARALENNQAVSWLPDHIKEGRFGDFLRNNVDWALSRERYWGTPLNIWVCERDASHMVAPESVAAIESLGGSFQKFRDARAKDPSLSEHLMVHKPWIDDVTFACPTCKSAGVTSSMKRVPEVIDCWYDSGCMPFAQWGYPHAPGSKADFERSFPADFISEAIDQTRGWFYSLLMISTLVFDEATQKQMGLASVRPMPHPYKTCVVLGHVGDREGKKESKSKGNYTPPEIILERVRMEFAVVPPGTVKGLEPKPGEAFVAREDYEGLDLTGEGANVTAYRARDLAQGTHKTTLRPTKLLPRRVIVMHPDDLAACGLVPNAKALETKPVEVPRLPENEKVWIEDPSAPAPGADAFRWFFYASSPSWTNTRHSLTNVRLEQKEFLVKLRNVYSFFCIYGNIDGFDPKDRRLERPAKDRSELDRWILSELALVTEKVTDSLDGYLLYDAARALVDFVESLSNWYVRRSRARFWAHGRFGETEPGSDGGATVDKADAYFTLYEVLTTVARLAAPFVPYFAEELWQNLVKGPMGDAAPESVHLARFPVADAAAKDVALAKEMRAVREVVSLGLGVRTNAKLRVRQPLKLVDIVASDKELVPALRAKSDLIAEELNVKEVRLLAPGEEAGFVKYALKPNFKALGPKLGKQVQACKAALAKADAGALRTELATRGKIDLALEGGATVELGPEEVDVAVEAAPGYAAAGGRVGVVVLATELDESLKDEGLAREVLARVQAFRKDAGLEFSDRIRLHVGGSDALVRVATANRAMLAKESLASAISVGSEASAAGGAATRELAVDGETLVLALVRDA